jgi:hypothetical protein
MPALGAAFLALVAWASCRNPNIELTPRERVWYDSIYASFESQYTSESPNLGYHRFGCLVVRADSLLGKEATDRVALHAERLARSRQSIALQDRRDERLRGEHPASTDEYCREVDSLWYASLRTTPRRE